MDNSVAEDLLQSHEYLTADLAESQRLPRIEERRESERKSVGIRAKITVPGKSVLPAHTVDLSSTGPASRCRSNSRPVKNA
jgi:hypothetical protein